MRPDFAPVPPAAAPLAAAARKVRRWDGGMWGLAVSFSTSCFRGQTERLWFPLLATREELQPEPGTTWSPNQQMTTGELWKCFKAFNYFHESYAQAAFSILEEDKSAHTNCKGDIRTWLLDLLHWDEEILQSDYNVWLQVKKSSSDSCNPARGVKRKKSWKLITSSNAFDVSKGKKRNPEGQTLIIQKKSIQSGWEGATCCSDQLLNMKQRLKQPRRRQQQQI